MHKPKKVIKAQRALDHWCSDVAQWALRAWRWGRVVQQEEAQFLAEVLGVWRSVAAQLRSALTTEAWTHWADRLVLKFSSRRFLRCLVRSFSEWSLYVSTRRRLCMRFLGWQRARLLRHVFHMWCRTFSIEMIGCVLARVAERQELWGMRRLRLFCHGVSVAHHCDEGRIARAWSGLLTVVRRRLVCRRVTKVLRSRLASWALERLCQHGEVLSTLEAAVKVSRAQKRCAEAVLALREHSLRSAQKALLPAVMSAWRTCCKLLKIGMRFELRCGLKQWRVFVRQQWTHRRRAAVADLISRRRRLREVLLPWQLLCSDALSSSVLIERWSDAVATPSVVRPLVMAPGHSK